MTAPPDTQPPTLREALRRCETARDDDERYEREVIRWLARLAVEEKADLATVNAAAAAFAALRAGDEAAAARLRDLCPPEPRG